MNTDGINNLSLDDQQMDVDNESQPSGNAPEATPTDQEILAQMNERRRSLREKKADLSRALALAPDDSGVAEKEQALEGVIHELTELEKRIRLFIESMEDRASLNDAMGPKTKRQCNDLPPLSENKKFEESLKVTKDMPRFKNDSDPRAFLDQVKHIVCAYVGDDMFEDQCSRYLSYLTVSSFHSQALKEEFAKRPKTKLTWDECEAIFLKIALTEQERIEQIKQLLPTGRESRETYRQFAMRISRDIRIYGVKDDNEMVLTLLSATVSPDTLNNMVARLHVRKGAAVDFTSINDFTSVLSGLVGPQAHINRDANGTSAGISTGASRNKRSRGSNRFSPTNKKPEPKEAFRGPNNRAGQLLDCKLCGMNPTHETAGHKQCSKCGRRGHSDAECRGDRHMPRLSGPYKPNRGRK
ncbi:hypothetical protein BC939DRAFT_497650 [Gamsiella multidivaricata]|uniref:uncharacterized protein n=1 Tax=Gamsiella multidivaricata TaxID=101098 RepID=UPI00221EAEC8|nr:uncharacterized protein BC939DRAFT_497650 [Gamsiella multidivaricata]KAI7816111.1 hypothetical protein BC939DRAFT_497650 [Gamsiella multidivaricata]